METLVHVVGESDTGLADSSARDEPRRRRRVHQWRAALDTAVATSDHATATILSDGFDGDHAAFPSTPLAGLLDALARDTNPPDAVELLLITGPASGQGVPTATIADGLQAALSAHPRVLAVPVSTIAVVRVAGFDADSAAHGVREQLTGGHGEVQMGWGSGATGLAISALAGVVESGRPWRLRHSRPPFGRLDLVPAGPADTLTPWLLRLGYHQRLLDLTDRGVLDPPETVREQAREIAGRLRAVAAGSRDAADLAEWVRWDLRRRDGTSAVAVRAWLEAAYRERRRDLDPDVVDLLDHVREYTGARTLGEVVEEIARASACSPELRRSATSRAGRWLLERVVEVNRPLGAGAHRFRPLPARVVRAVDSWLPPEPGGAGPGPSTGTVHLLWPAGRPGRLPSPAATLLSSGPHRRVLRHTGRDDRSEIGLHVTIVATTPESTAFADDQVRELHDAAPHGYRSLSADVVHTGPEPDVAQTAIGRHLDRRGDEPDVIIVVPVGPKPIVAAAFTAAVAYGRTRAIPVLVECTDLDRTEVTYHCVAAVLTADADLLRLATDALRRVECDTAARLLDLGSPDLQQAAEDARDLAESIRSILAPRSRNRGELMRLLRSAWNAARDDATRMRLLHLAGTAAPDHSRLRALRHNLPTAHGAAALPPTGTVDELFAREIRRSTPDTLVRCYRGLLRRLDDLG